MGDRLTRTVGRFGYGVECRFGGAPSSQHRARQSPAVRVRTGTARPDGPLGSSDRATQASSVALSRARTTR